MFETALPSAFLDAEWVLWVLFALSVISLGIAAERGIFFIRHTLPRGVLDDALRSHLTTGNLEAAAVECLKYDALESNVLRAGIAAHAKGPEAVESILQAYEHREVERFQRSLSWLATIGSNAPFVGLFGTVLGIIRAFADLARDLGNPGESVMLGISEALVATAVGLFVAIPAIALFNIFTRALHARIAKAREYAQLLIGELRAEPTTVDGSHDESSSRLVPAKIQSAETRISPLQSARRVALGQLRTV